MLPAYNLKEFININHQDVVRITASILKRKDQGLLDDLVQQFYHDCVKYNTIGRFDWTVPNSLPTFAMFIKRSIKNTILSEHNRQKRKFGMGLNDVELEDATTGNKVSVYNRIVPVNFEHGNRTNNGDVHVHPSYCGSHVQDETAHKDLLDLINGFKDHVKETETSSERTREMLMSYIALSEEGLKPTEIASEFKVTPTYITTLRKKLRGMFLDYQGYSLPSESM